MKLRDFDVFNGIGVSDARVEAQRRFNETRTDYPRDRTVHALFAEQAARTPEATAVFHGEQEWSYRLLDETSNRLARLLVAEGARPETAVGVLVEKSFEMAATLLGVLKAGCAYVPLDASAPLERARRQLEDTAAPMLITERRHIRAANRLQWDCPRLRTLICADSHDIHAEREGLGDMMREDVWDQVGRTAFDDISGGGWTSSYTGAWLSRAVMDQYGRNVVAKLADRLRPETRVLEIACASGITMFGIAPRVAYYCGTDLSAEILRWSQREVDRRGLTNITLRHLPAHDLDRLGDADFDVVILNSVIQCFVGHNYLRDVLRQAIARMAPTGTIFLGNLWDLDKRDAFVRSLEAFRREHRGESVRVKVDRSEELFVSRAFLEDLRHDLPEIQDVVCSETIGDERSELSEFGFDALLTIDRRASRTPTAARHRRQLDLRALEPLSADPVPERTHAGGLAYVMYTSGTSGQPKGVMIEHRSIVRLVRHTSFVTLGETDRCLQTGPLAFDASTFEIWGMLLNGGAVSHAPGRAVLESAELRRLIRHHGITTLWLTSSLFNHHADTDPDLFDGLRSLLIGGEALSVPHVNRVRERHPGLVMINGYGPTENTTFTACYRIASTHQGPIPIGRPIANSQVWVIDDGGDAVPIGVPGEICAAGDGLARGYVNDAALTRQRFVDNPFEPGTRMYRTGDLGRWRQDGELEFVGRLDDQVKIRGFRVEPGEIESRLREHPHVRDAAVVAREDGTTRQLVAFVTSAGAGAGADLADELRSFLRAALPDYMVPSAIVTLAQMPLSPNGKIDRRALPHGLERAATGDRAIEPPRSETERVLLEIWQEVLGQTALGVTESFWEAGGHSLKLARVMALVEQRLGVAAPLTLLFQSPTIRALAEALVDVARFGVAEIDRPLVCLGGRGAARTLFAFPPGTGDAAGFIQVAERLPDWAFQAFNFIEADTRLRDYADLVTEVDPVGPYVFFGYSSGGNLAYHVTCELERRGRRVSDLIMIDSGRKLEPLPFGPGEVRRIADEFLSHESVRHYLTSPVLRERAYRLIETSYAWIETAVDHDRIDANIHVITADGSPDAYWSADGRLLSSRSAWAEITRGTLRTYRGDGDHSHMLYQPFLDRNIEILRQVLETVRPTPGEGRGGLP